MVYQHWEQGILSIFTKVIKNIFTLVTSIEVNVLIKMHEQKHEFTLDKDVHLSSQKLRMNI